MKILTQILITGLLTAAAVHGQSRLQIEQLQSRAVAPGGLAMVVLPDGRLSVAALDGMVIDTSGAVPVLRVLPQPTTPPIREKAIVTKPTAPLLTLAIPDATVILASVVVCRNGMELSEGEDYTVSGPVITFVAVAVPLAGDVVKLRYRY